jgi:hypothetical protein
MQTPFSHLFASFVRLYAANMIFYLRTSADDKFVAPRAQKKPAEARASAGL